MKASAKSEVSDDLPNFLHSTDLIFVGNDLTMRCCGNVGLSGKKWCAMERAQCELNGPKSYRGTNKFESLQPRLYIRAHTADEDKLQAFCEPCVPLNKLNPELVHSMMKLEKSPADWGEDFALLNAGGSQMNPVQVIGNALTNRS